MPLMPGGLMQVLFSNLRAFCELHRDRMDGYEEMHAIRKGQIRWVAKADPVARRQFIHTIFGMDA
jgi:hypothetical protein